MTTHRTPSTLLGVGERDIYGYPMHEWRDPAGRHWQVVSLARSSSRCQTNQRGVCRSGCSAVYEEKENQT